MILVDANILLYAYDSESPHHEGSRVWLERTLNGEDDVRFALTTILAFLRISTDPRIHASPLTSTEAVSIVEGLLGLANVSIANPSGRHWHSLRGLAAEAGARGPLMMDAHLATLAIEHGARLATNDRDFRRFQGVKLVDPTAG